MLHFTRHREKSCLAVVGLSFFIYAAHLFAVPRHDSAAPSIESLPEGTNLPIQLGHELKAGSVKVGTSFVAHTTQRIPVALNTYLPAGVTVSGKVIASEAGDRVAGHPSILTLRFYQLKYKGTSIPLSAKILAIANFVQVMDAGVIATGSTDRGNPSPAGWTTNQVGGDQVYRSGWRGDVYSSYSRKVGFADYYGVYASPTTKGALPQALGVFSTTSAGLYGFDRNAALSVQGSNTILSDSAGRVRLRKGDDLLLQVSSSQPEK